MNDLHDYQDEEILAELKERPTTEEILSYILNRIGDIEERIAEIDDRVKEINEWRSR